MGRGPTSEDIPSALPGTSVPTIAETPEHPILLSAGTVFGYFVSLDSGDDWTPHMNELPPVAVRNPGFLLREANEVADGHGHRLWLLGDLTPLRVRKAPMLEQWGDDRPGILFACVPPFHDTSHSHHERTLSSHR